MAETATASVVTYLHGWTYFRPKWSEELINKETMVKKIHIDELRASIMKLEELAWIFHRDIRALDAALVNHVGHGGTDRHPLATHTLAGFLGTEDKIKLDNTHPETYATHDELNNAITNVKNYVDKKNTYYTRDFYQDFAIESFTNEGGYPVYTANFNIASLEAEVGKGLKVFLVTRVRAFGSGNNDYFNGVMPLRDTIVSLPPDVHVDGDNNIVTLKGIFNQPNIIAHNYHMAGNVRLAARITCAIKGDPATSGGSAMITGGI